MTKVGERCRRYRRRILDMSQKVSALHIAPCFSCVEIVDLVYNELLRPHDIFILSKGHAAVLQYIVLEERGILTPEDLAAYCTPRGRLGVHPDYGTPGIEASTGSLGHGLGIAVGRAFARQDRTVYVLLSDGELQEGSTWEAMQVAANLGLSNLVAIVDNNDFGGMDRMSEVHPALYPIVAKARAFNWDAWSANGHDQNAMRLALKYRTTKRPFMLVCKTTKGKGVSLMENNPIFHYRSPSPTEYQQALEEVEK